MKLKYVIKKFSVSLLGRRRFEIVKQNIKSAEANLYYKKHDKVLLFGKGYSTKCFGEKGCHVFFGYYDIPQFDQKERRLLVHKVPTGADPLVNDAELGYFEYATGEYHPITESKAWCWQQGSRLRWHPRKENAVIFNDLVESRYVTCELDLSTGEKSILSNSALYDIDDNCRYGLSINFSRLQRLRPGYGYLRLNDITKGEKAAENDGIVLVDLKSKKEKLIVTLSRLSKEVADEAGSEHYLNHISFSPNGRKFMFFHVYTVENGVNWKTRLIVYDLEKEDYRVLEDNVLVSHYCWFDDERLLITCYDSDRNQYYCFYSVDGGKKTIKGDGLNKDGHPTMLSDGSAFISDTYPLGHCYQTVFSYDIKRGNRQDILKIFSEPMLFDDERVDAHPRVSSSERIISIDSSFKESRRQIFVIDRGDRRTWV